MANARRFIGPGIAVLVVGVLGASVFLKIKKDEEKKKTDSVNAANGTTGAPARPDSAPVSFGAGQAIPVVGAEVKRAPLIIWVKAQGQAAAYQQLAVNSETSGRIQSIPVKENDVVRRGDTLMVLDTTEMVFALKQAQNSMKRAEGTFKKQTILERKIPDPAVRKEREAIIRMESGLVEAELSLQRAQMEYSKAATLAPFGGRIANMKVVEGQRVSGELMTIVSIDPIKVEAQVLQSEVAKVKVGNVARLKFASMPETTFTGIVESINPMVEQSTRTARVTVTVKNPRGVILPGMTASVDLQSMTYENKLLVPRKAILQRSDGRDMLLVYTPNKEGADGTADWRYVALGLFNAEFIEIVPGTDGSQKMVEPGEIVLVDGHYTIAHQTLIKLVEKLSMSTGRPF